MAHEDLRYQEESGFSAVSHFLILVIEQGKVINGQDLTDLETVCQDAELPS